MKIIGDVGLTPHVNDTISGIIGNTEVSNLGAEGQILSGMRAVITGSSKGIGREVSRALVLAGAEVVVHGGHCENSLDETVQMLRSQGGKADGVLADLSLREGRDKLLAAVFAGNIPPDIWINNAGTDILTGPLAAEKYLAKLDCLWHVDVEATIQLSRFVGHEMKKKGKGSIINIGWDQADWGMGGESGEIFGAIKGAVMGFTRALAKSLAPEVRVNCVAPGWIKTKWGENAPEAWQERAISESLSGRWGTPGDVAAAIIFLVNPSASFMTGQTIAVNGGRT